MSNTVVAAGAVLWREQAGDLQVALVHRARYDDWSFAKGKLDPGESIQRAAVREVREETGLRVKLGVRLASAEYSLPDGGKKVVHYWAAKVSRKALRLSDFKPDAEVEAIEWMSASVAAGRLDYDFDRELLATVVELHANSALDTRPVVVLRHAKALSRADWKARGGSSRDDAKRPLTDTGRNQAQALVPTLAAYALKRIYSSPWFRCRSTVAPLAAKRHLKIIDRDSFSEAGNAHNPRKTERAHRWAAYLPLWQNTIRPRMLG